MPFSKKLDTYPPMFFDLLTAFKLTDETIIFQKTDKKEAEYTRVWFYGFMKAFEIDIDFQKEAGLPDLDLYNLQQDLLKLQQRIARVKGDKLVFMLRQKIPGVQEMSDQLQQIIADNSNLKSNQTPDLDYPIGIPDYLDETPQGGLPDFNDPEFLKKKSLEANSDENLKSILGNLSGGKNPLNSKS